MWFCGGSGSFDGGSSFVDPGERTPFETEYAIAYRADDVDGKLGAANWFLRPEGEKALAADEKWRPSIHMPRWASRITLEINHVRIERLQDISRDDIDAEGTPDEYLAGYTDVQLGFRDLWDSIQLQRRDPGGLSWENNPWVWVVQFRNVT